jgi:hypothetical protein
MTSQIGRVHDYAEFDRSKSASWREPTSSMTLSPVSNQSVAARLSLRSNGSSWPAALCDHRQLPGIGTQRQQFDGEIAGINACSVPETAIALADIGAGKQTFNVRAATSEYTSDSEDCKLIHASRTALYRFRLGLEIANQGREGLPRRASWNGPGLVIELHENQDAS